MDIPAVDLTAWLQLLPQLGGGVVSLAGLAVLLDKTLPAAKRLLEGGTEAVTEHVIDPRIAETLRPVSERVERVEAKVDVVGETCDAILAHMEITNGRLTEHGAAINNVVDFRSRLALRCPVVAEALAEVVDGHR